MPQNSRQQNFWKETEAGKGDLARKLDGGTGDIPKRYGEPPVVSKLKIDLKTEEKANEVRNWSAKDVQDFSHNIGLNLQEANDLLSHMFLKEYDLPWYDDKGLYYYKSKLTPDSEVVFAFHKAVEGELTWDQKKWFNKLKDHELEEKN
ncbi:hypothetical protein MH215_05330 [Paenibacillus sp. ACRSA]|uniref:hypothetical protein n=1 Tax=Paenibacillus sp. ACRSA TaxID=2918211 RepID=UPI001EF5A2DB|nr:hypothetical protein [Paenibacillus sp. ACRSA]MCG7376406.1 hypothetical protein [Paenibacillus sp. ACRSA]